MPTKQFRKTVTLPPEQHAKMAALALEFGLTESEVICRAIDDIYEETVLEAIGLQLSRIEDGVMEIKRYLSRPEYSEGEER